MANEIQVLSDEVEEKFNVSIDYILIRCTNPNCNAHWGVSFFNRGNQILTTKDLTCRECALNEKAANR
jgi:hypothetical protein